MIPLISKHIIICADDYGQNRSISEGIVLLAEKKRINATSCMVNSRLWSEYHTALLPVQSTTFIGLHLNFTHGEALSTAWKKHDGTQFCNFATLLKNAYLQRLNRDVITAEIQAQLDAFTQAMNTLPDFIDGHQHIHQLPCIRDALFNVCPSGMFIRKTSNCYRDLLSFDGFPKRQLIALLGGITLQHRLKTQSIPSNASFSGIYNFKQAANYRHYFKQFLAKSQDDGLIMCHPGNLSDDVSDPLHLYRHHELNYFMSDDYLTDLADHSFQLRCKHHGD